MSISMNPNPSNSESLRPSAHTQRYDRQLRLWASSGQTSLETSQVLMIGSSHLSAQILKNLVLPGIGKFFVVDDATVRQSDLGNNFFLEQDSLGKSRAQQVAKFLRELNENVAGEGVKLPPESLLFSHSDLLSSSSLIISVNQTPEFNLSLSNYCWNGGITDQKAQGAGAEAEGEMTEIEKKSKSKPLMIVRGAGLIGQVRICLREMGIIDTHPDSLNSLRLKTPFPSLSSYFDSYNLDSFDSSPSSNRKPDTQEITHLPYPVILHRLLSQWRSTHSDHFPGEKPNATSKEKNLEKLEFRKLLQSEKEKVLRRCREIDPEMDLDLENWDEANDAIGTFVFGQRAEGRITQDLENWFKDPQCEVTKESSNFWLLINALRSFVNSTPSSNPAGSSGFLPLSGALPDFKSLSATYITLSKIYRSKSSQDISNFKLHLDLLLERLGLSKDIISEEEIVSFCKNAGFLKLIRGRNLNDSNRDPNFENIKAGFWSVLDPPGPVIQHHLAFLVADRFFESQNRWPGAGRKFTDLVLGINGESEDGKELEEEEVDLEKDATEMTELGKQILERYQLDDSMWEKVEEAVKEMVRSAHCDLPSTSALLGGIAAQESIKIITKQYIPLDNTAIYDGIKGSIGAFAL